MCRSPLALTVMSMRECRASRSSMWSRKPMPVETCARPDPSRSTSTSTSVSLVLRFTVALRMAIHLSGWNRALLSGVQPLSHYRIVPLGAAYIGRPPYDSVTYAKGERPHVGGCRREILPGRTGKEPCRAVFGGRARTHIPGFRGAYAPHAVGPYS